MSICQLDVSLCFDCLLPGYRYEQTDKQRQIPLAIYHDLLGERFSQLFAQDHLFRGFFRDQRLDR